MAQLFKSNPNRRDPYKNYRFKVYFGEDRRLVAGVTKVSGLKRKTEAITYRQGGSDVTTKVPGKTEFDPVTIELGVTEDEQFQKWADQTWRYGESKEGFAHRSADFRQTIVIELLNDEGQGVKEYKLLDCWVSEYTPLPELDASSNGVAIQSLTFEHEGWQYKSTAQPETNYA